MDAFQPKYVGDFLINGCVPVSEEQVTEQHYMAVNGVSLPDFAWVKQADMPVIKWDQAFDVWLDQRIELTETYHDKGICTYPWRIFSALPKNRKNSEILHWNQGQIPSCSFHGATHSYQNSMLKAILFGAPINYEAFNPIVPYWLSLGKRLDRGQDIFTLSKWMNQHGQYPARLVGGDNHHVPSNWEEFKDRTDRWQAGIAFLEDDIENKILKACKASLDVTFGSSVIWMGSKTDKNGVKIMDNQTFGGHAQSIGSYRKVGSEEYVFLQNSYGAIYGQSAEGEPKSGSWINRSQLHKIASQMATYGSPYVTFVEGEISTNPSFVNNFQPTFPDSWKK